MKSIKNLSIHDIVTIGMLSALCIVSIMIKIPYGNGAMVHLGTAAIFTIAILFGGTYAGLAGAIGSAFFDLLAGFSPYTIWSFFIKGVAGIIAGSIAHSGGARGKSIVKNILACVAAGIWTLGGYLVAWTVVIGKFESAVINIPSSLMSSGVGILVAIPLAAAIRGPLEKAGFMR
ncbi:MAG: ECF transporter S component [Clostridia bacterium]